MVATMGPPVDDPASVIAECPRCHRPDADRRFYGPCHACRADLVARYESGPSEGPVVHHAFEPKMHVTPNFVATKD
jgi:hypothetical protein